VEIKKAPVQNYSLDTGWEEKYDVNGFILKDGQEDIRPQ